MTDLDNQIEYWDRVAGLKAFAHPVEWDRIAAFISPDARILDYGCGYGRICDEFWKKGYRNVVGVDSSPGIISVARDLFPDIDFQVIAGSAFPFEDGVFDLVLLFTVLTSAPSDREQALIVKGARRVLRPNGLLYVSDMPLQTDKRNLERYDRCVEKYGTYGIFELPDGGVVRHHEMSWMSLLLRDFEEISLREIDVSTMNGHRAKAFQWVGRKAQPLSPRVGLRQGRGYNKTTGPGRGRLANEGGWDVRRRELGKRILDVSNLRGEFHLRSGQISSEYFDKYLFEADPGLLRAIVGEMSRPVPAGIDGLAGLELGGIPIVTMLSQITGIPALFVRKKPKAYGTCKLAEGGDASGKRLVVVEDVVTSGGQVIESARGLRDLGATVTDVLCVINRESGGTENLGKEGLTLHALFTMSELKRIVS